MKRDISIILSLIALVGVIILAMLWCCRSMSLSAVSLDTFIGVMAATIGLLVTFAIGWQVINALDIKNKLAEIEKLKEMKLPSNEPKLTGWSLEVNSILM